MSYPRQPGSAYPSLSSGGPPTQNPGYAPGYAPNHQGPPQPGYAQNQQGPPQPGYGQPLPPQHGYPHQQTGYPPHHGYPQQPSGYPPQQGVPQQQTAKQGYPQAIPPGAPPQQGYSMAPSAPPQYGSPETYLADNVGYGQPTAPNGWVRKASPKISISFTGHHLQDRDWTSKSDPMAVFFLYDVPNRKWFEAGRTEALRDTLDPDWEKEIVIDYYFEEAQKFRLEVYDKDDSSNKLKHHDFLGKCEGKIAELVSAAHGKKVFHLTDIRGKGMYGKATGLY